MIDLTTISTADLVAELSSRTGADYAPLRSEIVAYTSQAFNVSVVALLSRSRTHHLTVARTVAMALCREFTSCSLIALGTYFDRNHGTIIHAVKRFRAIEANPAYAPLVQTIRTKLAAHSKVSKTSVHPPLIGSDILKPDLPNFSGYPQP